MHSLAIKAVPKLHSSYREHAGAGSPLPQNQNMVSIPRLRELFASSSAQELRSRRPYHRAIAGERRSTCDQRIFQHPRHPFSSFHHLNQKLLPVRSPVEFSRAILRLVTCSANKELGIDRPKRISANLSSTSILIETLTLKLISSRRPFLFKPASHPEFLPHKHTPHVPHLPPPSNFTPLPPHHHNFAPIHFDI